MARRMIARSLQRWSSVAVLAMAIDLAMVELDGPDGLLGTEACEAIGPQAPIGGLLFVLLQPSRDRGGRDAAVRFLLEPRGGLVQRVAEIVVAQRRQDHAKRYVLLCKVAGPGVNARLQDAQTPQLHDLKFFPARSSARQYVAAAVRARVGYFRCVRDACDARHRHRQAVIAIVA